MQEFKQFTFSVYGTEIDYMQGLIDLISDVLGVPCDTTAAAQFADESATATFGFQVSNNVTLRLTRLRANTGDGSDYNIFINSNYASQNIMVKTHGGGSYSQVNTRGMGVAYYKSDNFRVFWFNAHLDSFNWESDVIGRFVVNNTAYAGGAIRNYYIVSQTFMGDDNVNVTFPTLLSYAAAAGYIDYMNQIPALSAGVKAFNVDFIKPCSTIAFMSNIALPNGKNYIALGTNVIVEVSAPESDDESA